MILTYTREMQIQDKLWVDAKEDLTIMEKLYHQIVEEAKTKDFKGIVEIFDGEDEKLAEVFKSEEQLNLAKIGKEEVPTFGYCKPLIEYLQELLN